MNVLDTDILKSILDKRILECFSIIREEREGSPDEEDNKCVTSRPTDDLLKSDILNPSPAPKRKHHPASSPPSIVRSPPPPPAKKRRPTSPPRHSKPVVKQVKRDHHYISDEDAKFAAELDLALNSTPKRKTRGAASGTNRMKPRSKKKVKNGDADGEDIPPKKKRAPNPNSAFNAPMLLSPQLSDVVFDSELPRPVEFSPIHARVLAYVVIL